MAAHVWGLPPAQPTLRDGEIHVWRVWPDASPASVETFAATLEAILSADERARAAAYCFDRDRLRFIFCRGALRTLLSDYTGIAARHLVFCYGRWGKPALTPACGGDTLAFNVAHTHGLALIAVTRARRVGVDVERIRPEVNCEEIAARFFAPGEVAALRALPRQARRAAFFACWTRKEAYIKACGEGLSLPLDRFEVSAAADAPAQLLAVEGRAEEAARWYLQDLCVGDGYAAALAVEGASGRLCCWDLSEDRVWRYSAGQRRK
ncbi:MAG TPA: 4'-phosphopantetheinyl transferase superfamily protein [Chthonomonadaceae bacterium]|nr:4'-phosphopantetheinyl transferase superfamily protein [Chthonomonadaceae bacterium]